MFCFKLTLGLVILVIYPKFLSWYFLIHSNDVGNIFCQQFLSFFADFARKSNKDTFDWRRRMQIFALYSGYIKVLQNSFDPIEIMISICIQVALLLGIFLSSSLAQKTKGSDHLAHSWGGLGRFLGSQWDRQLKFSANASFLIS